MKASKANTASAARALPPLLPAEEAASPPTEIRVLNGHSGARVTLCQRGDLSLVRKRAGTRAANARLMQQAIKQKLLAASGLPFPLVLGQGTDEAGLAYFDMDYVPARTLASAIASAASYDRGAVLSAIDSMLWMFRAGRGAALPAESFAHKIVEIAANCADHAATRPHLPAIRVTRDALLARSWTGVPSSPCHGDLTLENILVSPREGAVFIDCDEPFASSFWLDAGKLFQDVYGYWCLRGLLCGESGGAEVLNAIQKLEQLGHGLRALAAAADPALPSRLPQLAALHLFRTLPYTGDEATVTFVLARMRHVLGMAG
jgi:hypothetical protein